MDFPAVFDGPQYQFSGSMFVDVNFSCDISKFQRVFCSFFECLIFGNVKSRRNGRGFDSATKLVGGW